MRNERQVIVTDRLTLAPATVELTRAALDGPEALGAALGASVPPTWQPAVLIGRDQAGSVGGVTWYMNGIGNPLGEELVAILNRLGGEGWKVAGLGDLGFDARTEVILTREKP